MSYEWEAEVHVWPHSTGAGQDADQAAAGERVLFVKVHADDIRGAVTAAQLFARGVEANPRVWQAPLVGIKKVSH